jgi:RNA polymerase sigma-70 factor (ECF subfamily)
MNEIELCERCRQGDNKARKVLYEQYAGRLFGICIRYVGNRETAEDILHDGFLKIFCSFDKYKWRGEGSLRAWMDRIMVNTALQYLRKEDLLSRADELENIEEPIDEPDVSDVERIPPKVLMQMIGELPEGYRTVINLYLIEEKSHKEIAELLGINEKSSASQLCRAKAALAKSIKAYLKEDK